MKIFRGEIWLVNLDPVIGSEITKTRPGLVISHSGYNTAAKTISIIPISTGRFIESFHTNIKSLKEGSHAVIPQLRVTSKKRLIKKIGKASENELEEVQRKLIRYLDIRTF